MDSFSHVPPGFRFHPTDEELVDYYLRNKITSTRIDLDVIKDVDLYNIEPWDLQELCRIGTEEQNDWYFFSHKDKKYPTGTRTNRATTAGFWKATGRDKAIYSKHDLIGMRKTLVFYKGRAPNGQKSDWIMHEYRLETDENGPPQEEGWVVCRVFKKRIGTNHHIRYQIQQDYFLQLPLLESPKLIQTQVGISCNSMPAFGQVSTNLQSPRVLMQDQALQSVYSTDQIGNDQQGGDQVTDWRVLDKFVASQLSQEEISKENEYSNATKAFRASDDTNMMVKYLEAWEMEPENVSTPSSSCCQIDLWK